MSGTAGTLFIELSSLTTLVTNFILLLCVTIILVYLPKLFQLINSHGTGFRSLESESDTYSYLNPQSIALLYVRIHCHRITFLPCNSYNRPNVLFAGAAGQITRCQRWAEQWGRSRQLMHRSLDSPLYFSFEQI